MKEYVSVEGEVVTVCFNYSPNKIQAIKKIRGARFDRQTKLWRIPKTSLPALKKTWCFRPQIVDYIDRDSSVSPETRAVIEENPYSVSDEDISAAKPDVVFDLSNELLVLNCAHGSDAEGVIRCFRGVFYLPELESYYFPLHLLRPLITKLKQNNLLFAVHEEASEKLKVSQQARKKALSGKGFEPESLLGPYLDQELNLHRCPSVVGKKLEVDLLPDDLNGFLQSAYKLGVKVWLPSGVQKSLRFGRPVEDHLADYFEEESLLLIDHDTPCIKVNGKVRPLDTGEFNLECARTVSFEKYLEQHSERLKALEEKQKLLREKDADLSNFSFSSSRFPQELFPHQRVAVKWLISTKHAFLGDDMGLGKTVSVLAYFDALKQKNEDAFLLVVCPRSLCSNWYRESRKWTPKVIMTALPGDKRGRIKLLAPMGVGGGKGWDGLILNYEAARLDDVYPTLQLLCKKRPVLLCLDESQRVKNPASKTFQALEKFADLACKRVLLSGTPTPREFSDIWAQMRLLDGGQRLGKDYFRWLSRVAELGNDWSAVAVRSYKQSEVKTEIAKVQEILLRRKKEEVVNLPEKLFSVRDVELSGSQLKKYREVTKELRVKLSSVGGATYVKEIDNILEEYLRAVQVASNPRLVDEEWKGEPAKFLELDEIVNEVCEQGRKIVVWTNFRKNVTELCDRYRHFGARAFSGEVSNAERDLNVKCFQDSENPCKVLVAVPAAGGVGITLTAANTCVYIDKTWNGEHWMQSIDRVHRIGQTGTVSVISLNSCKVDQLISYNLAAKEKMLKKVMGDGEIENYKPTREELLESLKD